MKQKALRPISFVCHPLYVEMTSRGDKRATAAAPTLISLATLIVCCSASSHSPSREAPWSPRPIGTARVHPTSFQVTEESGKKDAGVQQCKQKREKINT